MSLRVLIIDDERLIALTIREFLEARGFQVDRAENAADGLQLLDRVQPDVVLLDLQLPDAQGVDLIPTFTQHPTHPAHVIIITVFPTAEMAVQALKRGAWNYLVKPINLEELLTQLQRLAKFIELEREVDRDDLTNELREMKTNNPQLRAAYRLAKEAARSTQPLCIVGEPGVGRRRLARVIHRSSPNRSEPFLVWTPANDPELQRPRLAELVGAEPGSLGPGSDRRHGLLSRVGTGTLVIQEVHSLQRQEQEILEQLLVNRGYQSLGGGYRAFLGRLMMTAAP
ncbi:MAG: response regulator, partial [bacterium]